MQHKGLDAMQINIQIEHTFEDPHQFHDFANSFAELYSRYFPGSSVAAPHSPARPLNRAKPTAAAMPSQAAAPSEELPSEEGHTYAGDVIASLQPAAPSSVLREEAVTVGDATPTPAPKRSRGRPKATAVAAPDAQRLPAAGGFGSPSATSAPAVEAPAAPDKPLAPPAPSPSGSAATFEDVKIAFSAVCNHEAALDDINRMMTRLKCTKLREVKPEHYGEVVAELKRIEKVISAPASVDSSAGWV